MNKEILNSIWLMLGKLNLILGTLIFFSILSKNIDQTSYGEFTILLLILSTASVFCQAGINLCFSKFYNYFDYDKVNLIKICMNIQFLLSFLVVTSICIYLDDFYSSILIFCVLFKPFDIYKSAFDAELMSNKYQKKEILITVLFSVVKVYFAFYGDLPSICIVFLIEKASVAFMLRRQKPKLEIKRSYMEVNVRDILRESIPMLIPSIMYIMYSRIDQAVIYNTLSAIEQAKYFAATQISEGFGFIATSIAISYFSSMTKIKDSKEYKLKLEAACRVISAITIPIALIVTFFGEIALTIIFTEEYASSSTALSILAWCVVILGLSSISVKHLIYIGKQKYSIYRAIFGLVLNLPLTLILTSHYGIEGAALATLISQFCALVLSNLFFKETRFLFFIQIRSLFLLRAKA